MALRALRRVDRRAELDVCRRVFTGVLLRRLLSKQPRRAQTNQRNKEEIPEPHDPISFCVAPDLKVGPTFVFFVSSWLLLF